MSVDPYILTFSAITVFATIWMGFWAARKSKTASDFFVAGRSVSVGWNASAISGEYLSAASFMGIAGMVMSVGYDALWYPVCYACGYLFLLLFIAGPLRRFGAYTVPDLAEGRFDSPLFRKIAVVFVLFIGFFYTMPQMKGAGTTLAYIFPGLPYWVGVVLVGMVITLNVALGGMKGITLVQAFQYWAKMFAISVPVFVLMAVYGHYGNHLGASGIPIGWNVDSIKVVTDESNFVAEGEVVMIGQTNSVQFPIEETDNFVATLAGRTTRMDGNEKVAMRRKPLPEKAPKDEAWLAPFGPLTTKAAKAARISVSRTELESRLTTAAYVKQIYPALPFKVETHFAELVRKHHPDDTGTKYELPGSSSAVPDVLNYFVAYHLGGPNAISIYIASDVTNQVVSYPTQQTFTAAKFQEGMVEVFKANGLRLEVRDNDTVVIADRLSQASLTSTGLSSDAIRGYSLLYTYSLIIALVCGTAGLPHILVRFYTNPDGVAAKRTTMWVMILIGVFYVFPPVFGVIGRNLMPELYAGVGAKGTDKIVLELPRLLNEKYAPLGSILSGITCAGAFAAFMSTFSGLLVSMTGAMAHDVYGRMLNPKATAEQRLRAFKIAAVIVGGVAIVLGTFVEPLQINFMVGQAFAIAAASYFPLLFMAAWWRNLTMKGAATGMLTGGLLAMFAISLTSFSDLAQAADQTAKIFAMFKPMAAFWAAHPLLRILCEQPAIWAVPLALGLMIVVSKLTRKEVPADIRMKMLVLHAPEQLGLKQEYIQEHQQGH